MENLTSRYARTLDLIVGKVFRSIDAVELEEKTLAGTLQFLPKVLLIADNTRVYCNLQS